MGYKFEISAVGIVVNTYSDTGCQHPAQSSPPVPFGSCIDEIGITIDLVDHLPAPVPGRALERRCWAQRTCDCASPVYLLRSTRCEKLNDVPVDTELDCEDGVNGYSSYRFKSFSEQDGTCAHQSGVTDVVNNWQCTNVGGFFAAKAVWCGGECAIYKTLHSRQPICDPPWRHSSPHAVDMGTLLGQRCSNTTHPPGAGSCCYSPLGYAGGSSLGTSCTGVCLYYGRYGTNDGYCADTSNKYGNCFCGPKIFGPRAVEE